MNESNSAGGVQKGPVPPAVGERRTTIVRGSSIQVNRVSTPNSIQRPTVDRVLVQSQQQTNIPTTPQNALRGLQSQQHHYHQQMQPFGLTQSSSTTGMSNTGEPYSKLQPTANTNTLGGSHNSGNNITSNQKNSQQMQQQITVLGQHESSDQSSQHIVKTQCPRPTVDSLVPLKKRILEHKKLRLAKLKENHLELVSELYFLENGWNMMDYPSWRKKQITPQFNSYPQSYRLDTLYVERSQAALKKTENTLSMASASQTNTVPTSTTTSIVLSHGPEIKIPGVGVTPVAVSTQLPAAVKQLSQQGHVPGRPQGGRHGMVFGQLPVPVGQGAPSVPLVPGGISIGPESALNDGEKRKYLSMASNSSVNSSVNGGSQDQFSVKAKQEVYVLQRISELQREGLWAEKRLPKLQEPQRPKAHWDYLLEEMVWLAADFAQERKWKKAAAKKCARMVQKHFQEKAQLALRAEKAQELQLKRIAGFLAKEIKVFWSNVEKLVDFKHQTKLEEKRKRALDQHLSFIVDQTEKFSQQLAEGMNKPAIESGKASLNSSRRSSPHASKNVSDDEFSPGNASSDDDEETIARAEQDDTNVKDEVAALQKESEMNFDDFLKELPKNYLENRTKINISDSDEEDDGSNSGKSDDEFNASNEDSDDVEDTIKEQERNEKNLDHKRELDELNADNNLSIDQLIAKFKKTPKKDDSDAMEVDSDDESEMEASASESEEDEEASEDEQMEASNSEDENLDESFNLKDLMKDDEPGTSKDADRNKDKDDLINDAAAIAESIQPKGNTLSSTNVVTPVPFLLRHSLREYQHIGLDWLVTMHDRKLNGILADEMGLGKTIQAIALLAHLACVKENWGPHLIVVPSSVMLNWEMEFKKWCPGFKILTYYGTQKERKIKRIGWTKFNAFHVCITSYKLVIQDHQSFRRKKWQYLILDEAQNIKNFKSQRWQLLLNFQTEQRLLLTGTPLQNNLMELWSLMHFLMPHVFQSHREFKEWFSNPMTGMIEGNSEYNESIIKRLHKVLRPFLLRRLKSEVEKQMPKKYEHVVMCRLSKRQRFLYDDFMSRAKTRETLASGNLLSVINVLMQLRKVCNHPNLFEVRPTISPFRMDGIEFHVPSIVYNMLDYNPLKDIDLHTLNLVLIQLEACVTAYVAHRIKSLQTPRKLIEEIDKANDPPPPCPPGKFKLYVRVNDARVKENIQVHNGVKVGTSPAMISGQPIISMIRRRREFDTGRTINPFSSQSHSLGKQLNDESAYPSTIVPTSQRVIVRSSTTHTQSVEPSNPKSLAAVVAQQLNHHSYAAMGSSETTNTNTVISNTEYVIADKEQTKKENRTYNLHLLAKFNKRKCEVIPIYGEDFRDAVTLNRMSQNDIVPISENSSLGWTCRSYINCLNSRIYYDNWSLSKAIKSYKSRVTDMEHLFKNFVLFVPPVSAPLPYLHVSHPHPSKLLMQRENEIILHRELSPKLNLLHPIISEMNTKFPDPRLIQYDCGKLQTLDRLLRQLKTGGHKVLIFTQMTRMLDVLEAFLNYHGHIYLRLDGTTKIEQRQLLMDRFNADKRIFVFILSTRSGGVGINLTGADTVIFYDSDWNPTMDAQAQDRCHRIGQTRDVHIYRLISEKTIEENILKKANQKRLLGDLAIEGGNFTTAYFKSSTIHDLFNVNGGESEDQQLMITERSETVIAPPLPEDKSAVGAFESALACAEDEQDVEAAKTAKAEAVADLAEFDENIPIEETEKQPEISKAEQEVENLISTLSPIEKYAMRFVEETGGAWTAEQLKAAEAEIEQKKREWEANRIATLQKEEELAKQQEEEENNMLTYSRAQNQIWISEKTGEIMPMWCPPTPPQDDNDLYIDYSLAFLYDTEIMNESMLPPVYVRKEYKRRIVDVDGQRPIKIRKEDTCFPPRSLFDRPSPAVAKLRRDIKLQRYRGTFKANIPMPGMKPQLPLKPPNEQDSLIEWSVYEDISILNVIQNLQGLPLNLMLISPGHTPNWDLIADTVNQRSRTYRTPKHCRYRFETVIIPREEGKLMESPKKQKKSKNAFKTSPPKGLKAMRTALMYSSDNNASFTRMMRTRYDAIRAAYIKKQPQLKQMLVNPSMRNARHAVELAKYGITDFDNCLSPIEIAARRLEKYKVKVQEQQAQQHQQQQLQQIQVQQGGVKQLVSQQGATILVHPGTVPQNYAAIAQNSGTTAMVKAIVAAQNQSGIVTNTIQHIPLNQAIVQQQQNSGQLQQVQIPSSISTPGSVSVVLTTPITTIAQSGQQQIVSIQPNPNGGNSGILSQTGNTTVLQNVTVSNSQVVSLASLNAVTSSSGLQPNVTMATLTSSGLRAQRIITTPGMQEVVVQQRGGAQSPTVVSISGLGQASISPAQLQTAQLRLSMAGAQQVSNVKTIPISQAVKTSGSPQTSQIQFYKQPMRQQLKVIHATPGQSGTGATVVQTAGGHATLVAPGAIIQGNLVQSGQMGQTIQVQQQGGTQKLAVSSVGGSSTGGVPNIATVQVAPGQARAQFIKHVGMKQTIGGRQVDNDMLVVKRSMPGGQNKTQIIPQGGQVFAPVSVQMQQPSNSGQQQIATLVKTSGGVTTTAANLGMTISQLKSGQIKAIGNPQQMRQFQIHPQLVQNPRKMTSVQSSKVAQLAQLGKAGVPTQFIVQNSKNLPAGTVSVHQVIRHAQPTGIVLGKAGRMIPVSVGTQSNRQTIQVVPAASGQAGLTSANLRTTHVSGAGALQGTIKVAGTASSQQQAIFTALQSQRQNASPVRLQTTSGALVVAVQTQPQTSMAQNSEQQQFIVGTSNQQQGQHHPQIITVAQSQLQQAQQQQQQQQQPK